ncbi:MAG: drug/metabolite transporter (DMT)-like permease [Alphaproteobacteria bacterium]|jgi:drug/metabolite transporter (DMT)-like permease
MKPINIKTFTTTLFALFAFAGNSVLCRLALGDGQIDATSFTIIRLVSGALAFMAIFWIGGRINRSNNTFTRKRVFQSIRKKWIASAMLFVYAVGFSFAYIALDTGVGALVLFGTVQLTMIAVSIYKQEQLPWHHIVGIALAFCGLWFLIYSQLDWQATNLSLLGFVFMVFAGMAWGGYTLLGRGSTSPFIDTSANFMLSVLFCIPLLAVYLFMPAAISADGFWLAVSSGVITSAFGYAIWYVALPSLSRVQAGVVQLLVPIIAAVGGAIWVGEAITLPLIIAQTMVLGGIAMVMIKAR